MPWVKVSAVVYATKDRLKQALGKLRTSPTSGKMPSFVDEPPELKTRHGPLRSDHASNWRQRMARDEDMASGEGYSKPDQSVSTAW
jgi:hypothetical protein